MLSWFLVGFSFMLTSSLALLIAAAFVYLVYDLRYRAWVETKNKVAKQMVELASLKIGERVYDLGCGDARILIEAAKKTEIAGIGYEINPVVILLARLKITYSRCSKRISIQRKDFFKENLRDADVVFLYLFPEMLARLEPKLKKELLQGTRIVSNSFPLKQFHLAKTHPENEKVRLYIA